MIIAHGIVQSRQARPHPAYPRYIAVLDVLGMKSWLNNETAQNIAEKLDEALIACDQSSSGEINGVKYGPIIGTTHFSDTLFAWSPDDSWASLSLMCSSVKMIVGVALSKGVPLRGAISLGNIVCCKKSLRFVGQPIADAFEWSEKQRKYRSAGVDITPSTITLIREKLGREPIPPCFDNFIGGIPTSVLRGEQSCSSNLMWYENELFLNHWAHGMFQGCNPSEMFFMRGLPNNEDAERKAVEMSKFYYASNEAQRNLYNILIRESSGNQDWFIQQIHEYNKLETIKNNRAPF